MTTIIIIGGREDDTAEKLIIGRLSATSRITYIKNDSLYVCGSGYEILCFESERPEITDAENAIIVAKKNAVLPEKLPAGCTVIINSESTQQIAAVRNNRVFAVDCGFSPTSTVSFSSEKESTAVISLNRVIKALSGREIQPLELPAEKRGSDIYSLMSYTALRLLLDDRDSDLGELM